MPIKIRGLNLPSRLRLGHLGATYINHVETTQEIEIPEIELPIKQEVLYDSEPEIEVPLKQEVLYDSEPEIIHAIPFKKKTSVTNRKIPLNPLSDE